MHRLLSLRPDLKRINMLFFGPKCLGEKSEKNLRKSGKSQGKIREFDGIKKVGTMINCLPYESL